MLPTLTQLLKANPPSFEQHLKSGDCVHVIIDVQRHFCDPNFDFSYGIKRRGTSHTNRTAQHIASVSEQLRQFMPTIIIYSAPRLTTPIELSLGGLHHLKQRPNDILCPKTTDSACRSGSFKDELKKLNPNTVLFSGFNATACLAGTVNHARSKDYKRFVMHDLVGQDLGEENWISLSLLEMRVFGARIIHSEDALSTMHP